MSVLTWLHLSDFHFRAPPEDRPQTEWRRDRVTEALARDLPGLLENAGLAPDLTFVTGDIAQAGKAEEYAEAARFFQKLADIPQMPPKARWFFTPGNHDVDRALVTGLDRQLRALLTEDGAGDLLDDAKAWPQFAARQAAFFQFTKDFLGEQRAWDPSRPWKTETIDCGGRAIAVLALNTAWASQDDADRGRIMLGEQQVEWALAEAQRGEPALKIALMHHPLADLATFDEEACGDLLRSPRGCRFLLHGHLHRTRLSQNRDPDGAWLELAAGACWEKPQSARNPYAFGAVAFDLERRRGSAYVWRYSPRKGGFWTPDNDLYQGMADGRWAFSMAGPSDEDAAAPASRGGTGVASGDWVPMTYREYLETELRHLEPLLDGEHTVAFRLREVYEPLDTDWREPQPPAAPAVREDKTGNDGKSEDAPEPAEAVPERRPLADLLSMERPRHFAAGGEPGGGKSTFVNYTALAALREPSGPLPIRLELEKFGRWLETREGEGGALLPAWAGECLGEHGLDEQAVRARCGQGRALWLLDGLDEIFNPALRERAARIIAAWFRREPGNRDRVVVMSRPHALDDANTAKALALAGGRANILPLDEAAQARFLTKWFLAVFEGAAGKAERRRDELWSALARHGELQRMKKTPLLLSMIAAVFNQGRRLPDRRAELYGKAIGALVQRRFGPRAPGGGETLARRAWYALTALARGMLEAGLVREGAAAGFGEGDFRRCLETGFYRDRPETDKLVELDVLARTLASHSGLIAMGGDPVRYRFAHFGFQEYLAAWSFANERDPIAALGVHLDEGPWRETVLLTAGCLNESNMGRVGEDFVRALLKRAGRGAAAHGRLELALSAAVEAPGGVLPLQLLDDLRRAAVSALGRKRSWSSERARAALGLALGRAGDPRLGMARADRWVRFEPGEFTMGSQAHGKERNRPEHRVALTHGFWLGRYPVSCQEYREFVEAGGYRQRQWWRDHAWAHLKKNELEEPALWRNEQWNGPNQPVVGVSWHEAEAYCRWLTAKLAAERPSWLPEGCRARLPTEAEWEYAARGGTARPFPWGDDAPDRRRANYDQRLDQTSAVGIYAAGATAEGLWDMAGNVREWCADPWDEEAYQGRKGLTRDPVAEGDPVVRALRGGSWISSAVWLPAAFRFGSRSWIRFQSVGFRCLLSSAVSAERG